MFTVLVTARIAATTTLLVLNTCAVELEDDTLTPDTNAPKKNTTRDTKCTTTAGTAVGILGTIVVMTQCV